MSCETAVPTQNRHTTAQENVIMAPQQGLPLFGVASIVTDLAFVLSVSDEKGGTWGPSTL